jgi:hypothetical protein
MQGLPGCGKTLSDGEKSILSRSFHTSRSAGEWGKGNEASLPHILFFKNKWFGADAQNETELRELWLF